MCSTKSRDAYPLARWVRKKILGRSLARRRTAASRGELRCATRCGKTAEAGPVTVSAGHGGPAQAAVGAPDSPPPHAVGADGGAWYRGRPAPVAQWIERSPPKRQVARSIRAGGTSPASGAGSSATSRVSWPSATSCCGSGPEERRRDQIVRRGPIAGGRHVVQHGEPQQRLHIDVVRLHLEGLPEEDEHVGFTGGDERAR